MAQEIPLINLEWSNEISTRLQGSIIKRILFHTNLYLLMHSSRQSLQNLWPHLVWIGSLRGKWHIKHCKSSSTASTKSSSKPSGWCSSVVDSAMMKTFGMQIRQWAFKMHVDLTFDTNCWCNESYRISWLLNSRKICFFHAIVVTCSSWFFYQFLVSGLHIT